MSNLKGTMKIIFRANGSRDIGLGHIVRCLTLAEELKNRDSSSDILFITGHKEGQEVIAKRGYRVVGTQTDEILQIKELGGSGTLLITDFLDTDHAYMSRIKEIANLKVICIDNNTHLKKIDADMLINANVFDEGETKTIGLTRYYLGPKYVILRKEFELAHREGKKIKDNVGTILVVSGGADFARQSLILNSVKTLRKIGEEIGVHLIIGPAFQYKNELNDLLSKTNRHFYVSYNPPNLVDIMKSADMAITAAGITLYELATLGIPSIAIPQITPKTSHQEDIARSFERYGACINLGKFPNNELVYVETTKLMEDKSLREQLSDNGKALVDGEGLGRTIRLISELCHQVG